MSAARKMTLTEWEYTDNNYRYVLELEHEAAIAELISEIVSLRAVVTVGVTRLNAISEMLTGGVVDPLEAAEAAVVVCGMQTEIIDKLRNLYPAAVDHVEALVAGELKDALHG